MNSTTPLLQLHDINLRVGGRMLFRGLRWELGEFENWAIIGSNGAGKTVLSELLTGKRFPSSGELMTAPGFDPHREISVVSFETQQQLQESDQRHDISEYSEAAFDAG